MIVIKVPGASTPEALEWVELLDWKAYVQTIRIHTHEHLGQVERTVGALAATG